ncbi:MAG: 5-methyltetrahydropteroyltriglutamate--homocysteine S-methyltransferase [Alphaproteobacteria bacterium]
MVQLPFRAEHIGSLLRPAGLLEMRARHEADEVGDEELRAAEDAAIDEAIALQTRSGLKVVTDGEFRRHAYHDFFFEHLGDVTIGFPPVDAEDARDGAKRATQPVAIVKSRLKWTAPIHAAEVTFLKERSDAEPKVTLPGPCTLHFRGGAPEILRYGAYDDIDAFWADIVDTYAKEFEALTAAGCTYVQIDETAFAKFSDPAVQQTLTDRGEDWQSLIDDYIDIMNRVLARAPAGLNIGMHLCRGNRGGHFHAEGGYDIVAEKLFNALDFGFYFLEYDSPRAGDFSPLRFLPAGKSAVLGLVSTKSERMETKDDLKRRIDEAGKFADPDRLALSPQCGFASVASGNPITPEIQEAKLRLVVETAAELWADA